MPLPSPAHSSQCMKSAETDVYMVTVYNAVFVAVWPTGTVNTDSQSDCSSALCLRIADLDNQSMAAGAGSHAEWKSQADITVGLCGTLNTVITLTGRHTVC